MVAQQQQPNWVDQLIENNLCGVFGEHCARSGSGGGQSLRSSYRFVVEASPPPKDYAAEHDAFLDSLLHEQQKLAGARCSSGVSSLGDISESRNSSSRSIQSNSSWTLSPASSNSSIGLPENTSSRKRRRPVRLHRKTSRSPLRNRKSSSSNSYTRSNTVNLNELGETQPPATFVHPQCRMQKDKGKGDQVGSNICAKGVDGCLEKLRAKMQLLTEHCLEQGSSATMKRRSAIVVAVYDNFVETRSLLTLRMGFLSMTYGVLLRWDTGHTGKVSLVVLRKNCHDSFYKSSMRKSQPNQITPCSSMNSEEGLDLSSTGGLDPPYLVPRPDSFVPPEISVSVLYATGLDQKSHWTVQLQLGDETENILLAHDNRTNLMVPKLGDALSRSVSDPSALGVLEIKLLEHKLRKKQRVLRCSMRVPCASLEPQSSDSPVPVTMRIPCPDGATIQIEAILCSDEAVWQQRELEERRRVSSRKKSRKVETTMHEEDMASPWDWICMVC